MSFLIDLKQSFRGLLRSPGYALPAIVTMALGIGVTATVLETASTTLRRPLPFYESDRLVVVSVRVPELGIERASLSAPFYEDMRELNRCFESLFAFNRENMNLTGSGTPTRLAVARVSAGAAAVLGVDLHLGRDFTADEDTFAGPRAVILAHALWQQRFGGDVEVLGTTVTLNGDEFTVTGVLSPNLAFPLDGGPSAEAWIPVAFKPKEQSRGYHDFKVVARLAPAVSSHRLTQHAEALLHSIRERNPGTYDGRQSLNLDPVQREAVRDVRATLLLLQAAVAVMLLIVCFNVSSLLLARFSSRGQELAIRRALGSSPRALLRPVVAESLVLVCLGGLAGLLVAAMVTEASNRVAATRLSQLGTSQVDGSLVLVHVGLITLCTVLVSLLPAWWAGTRKTCNAELMGGARGGQNRRAGRLLGLVMVAQIALTLVMLVGAGLFVRSLHTLLQLDPGFDTDRVMSVRVSAPAHRYPEMSQVQHFFVDVLDRIRALPGVDAAGGVAALPLGGLFSTSSFLVEGRPNDSGGQHPHTHFTYATEGYFETMGIGLLQGRTMDRHDSASAAPVVVVNEAFAQAFWPGQPALGKRIAFIADGPPAWREVVGVTANVHLTTQSPVPDPVFYVPLAQRPFSMDSAFELSLVIRTALPPQALLGPLRAALAAVDPDQPIYDVQKLDDLLTGSISARHLVRDVLSAFALIAVVLAAVGVYGVVAFVTGQRRHEFGVRIALGARPRDLAGQVLGRVLRDSAVGLLLGLPGAFIASQGLLGLLYATSPSDPTTYLVTAGFLTAVALLASLVPALRAAAVDPVTALRTD